MTDHPYGYGPDFMMQVTSTVGIADQCLPKLEDGKYYSDKVARQEADFMKQIDDDVASGKYGAAILPAEQYLRLQCLHVAEKQVGLMPKEVLEYAEKYYAFVAGK